MILIQTSPTQVAFYANQHDDDVDWLLVGKGARVVTLDADQFAQVQAWQNTMTAGSPEVPGTPANPGNPNATPPVPATPEVATIPAVPPVPVGNQVTLAADGTVHLLNPDGSEHTVMGKSPDPTVTAEQLVPITLRARVIID